jgi:hypothetical protein
MLRKHLAVTTIAFAVFCLVCGPTLAGEKSSYDFVLEGKKCETRTWDQTLSCEYVVGTGLTFIIAGIGQPDTAITFMKSSFDGDFFATYSLLHGCVIVKHGTKEAESGVTLEPDYAFVSPRNGKVYKRWDQCQAAW